MIDAVATSLTQREPEAHIQLNKKMAKGVKDFKPGQIVKVTLVGKVCDMNFRFPEDPEASGFEGSVCIEMTEMQIGISQKNAMAELLDDDE